MSALLLLVVLNASPDAGERFGSTRPGLLELLSAPLTVETVDRAGTDLCLLMASTAGVEVCKVTIQPPDARCLSSPSAGHSVRSKSIRAVCRPESQGQPATPESSKLVRLAVEYGVRRVRPLPLETGRASAPQALFGHHGRRSGRRDLPPSEHRVLEVQAENGLAVVAQGRIAFVERSGDFVELLSAFPLAEVMPFPAIGVLVARDESGNGAGGVRLMLEVFDLREGGPRTLQAALPLGHSRWFRDIQVNPPEGSTSCFLAVALGNRRLMTRLETCPVPAPSFDDVDPLELMPGEWCFSPEGGWSRCSER